jgi:hypothetical protein
MAMLETMRPDVIKLLSGFPENQVAQIVNKFPNATYIVRAFLSFGGRKVTPDQFYEWTIGDVFRTVDALFARGVGKDRLFLELHNEPNLVDEGLVSSWADGKEFGSWLSVVASKYKQALGNKVQLVYPGLSPGDSIANVRQESNAFFLASKFVLSGSVIDAVGIHGYWSPGYDPLTHPYAIMKTVNWYNANANGMPLHITEASNNSGSVSFDVKATQYVDIWNQLKSKPNVKTISFFVLSASNSGWGINGSKETWNGSMASIVRGR